jgi:cytoskeletal protein CcmA (bactofilin family)
MVDNQNIFKVPPKTSDSNSLSSIKEQKALAKSMPSIISKDVKIDGEISSLGMIEIEGHIKGGINSNSVAIREDGIVDGNVNVCSIDIRGTFSGYVKAQTINIFSKAKVNATIEYCTLSVEDGASIEGQFKKIDNGIN